MIIIIIIIITIIIIIIIIHTFSMAPYPLKIRSKRLTTYSKMNRTTIAELG